MAIISELQRRIAPVQLSDATFALIEEHLIQQFSTAKSTIGASVQFLTCKHQQGQSLEDYSRKLNSLASVCNYTTDCLDRLLRDTFVAGLVSSSILSSLIQECNRLTFRETLERAKLLETFREDAKKINSSRDKVCSNVEDINSGDINKIHSKKNVPKESYICYRCGVIGKHFSNDCFAKSRICHNCNKTGHVARICQQRKKSNSPQRSIHQVSSGFKMCQEGNYQMDNDNIHALENVPHCGIRQLSRWSPIGSGTSPSTPHAPSTPHLPAQPRSSCCLSREAPRVVSSPTEDNVSDSSPSSINFDDSFLG